MGEGANVVIRIKGWHSVVYMGEGECSNELGGLDWQHSEQMGPRLTSSSFPRHTQTFFPTQHIDDQPKSHKQHGEDGYWEDYDEFEEHMEDLEHEHLDHIHKILGDLGPLDSRAAPVAPRGRGAIMDIDLNSLAKLGFDVTLDEQHKIGPKPLEYRREFRYFPPEGVPLRLLRPYLPPKWRWVPKEEPSLALTVDCPDLDIPEDGAIDWQETRRMKNNKSEYRTLIMCFVGHTGPG